MQITHRRNQLAPGGVPHEKTDLKVALKIKRVMEPPILSEKEEGVLHYKDEDTTWFGILREKGELPMFQDYGRYANLMANAGIQDQLVAQETRYPGVVSFVGQTGMRTSYGTLVQ